MKCGKCSGRCPAFKDMDIKPHQFVTMLGKGKIDELLECKAIWNCLSCMACVERCPRGVAPAAVVEAVRDTVIRMQGKNGIKAEEIPPIVDELIPQQLLVSAYRKYNK
ncbi:MAG: heterodisulfide reductase [Clostridiales bacterium]|nr:heterodisulfide reductase [Clostridiales bacterium]